MRPSAPLLRFGGFELDRESAELLRSGRRVHLSPQAFQLLLLLADRPGVLVTREEIRKALWRTDVHAAPRGIVRREWIHRAAVGDRTAAELRLHAELVRLTHLSASAELEDGRSTRNARIRNARFTLQGPGT